MSLDERAPAPAPVRRSKSTMMGMPVLSVPPPEGISHEARGGRVIPFASAERRSWPGAAPRAQSTLLGLPSPDPAPSTSFGDTHAQAHAHGFARARSTTDPGFGFAPAVATALERELSAAPVVEALPSPAAQPSPTADAAEPAAFAEARPRHDVTYDERIAWPGPTKPKRSLRVPALVGGLALLAAAGAFAFALFADREGEERVRARVATVGGHESLVVEVPRAGFGARVRFRGREIPLVAARAVVPLFGTPLPIGENRLALGLVGDDGRAEELPLDVTVAYRIRPDLSALTAEPPRLRVQVEALPGTAVELDGERLALDERGRGHRDFPVRGRPVGNVITETVRYRVVPPSGAAETGEVTARVPLATLELDRPGSALVTDADSVAVEGAAQSTAAVFVNGVPVPVRDGRFRHVVALPTVGEHQITVVAREAGHVPERESVVVRRVADLAAEARAYEAEPSLTYARIAADPDGSRGRRVALEGVVYNVDVRRGESMLQVLVTRCGEARCPLWVTYPAATDVGLDQAVRVLGVVDGEQRFRTTGPTEQILTVPRVRAVYVLPMTP